MLTINGNSLAKKMNQETSDKIEAYLKMNKKMPQLDIILVEADQASAVYVNMIIKKCQSVGIVSNLHKFPSNSDTKDIILLIEQLNKDSKCDGIIVQFPLPKQIDEQKVRATLSPEKDVDAMGYKNIGKFYAGLDCYNPCTPESMLRLLKSLNQDLTGKNAVVVGRSLVVGRPIAELLIRENCTVTICHSKTTNLAEEVSKADIVMAAVGSANLIDKSYLKKDAIVIDAGINVTKSGLCGDVNPEGLNNYVKALTPVPGGVGPVTIAVLIKNVLKAYERKL